MLDCGKFDVDSESLEPVEDIETRDRYATEVENAREREVEDPIITFGRGDPDHEVLLLWKPFSIPQRWRHSFSTSFTLLPSVKIGDMIVDGDK